MNEDKNLKRKAGKENPFKVPENYFESLIPKITDNLPEKTFTEESEPNLWTRVKPWVYMVAMFGGMMFGLRVMIGEAPKINVSSALTSEANKQDSLINLQEEYLNTIATDIIMDDYTLYLYLSDANTITYK